MSGGEQHLHKLSCPYKTRNQSHSDHLDGKRTTEVQYFTNTCQFKCLHIWLQSSSKLM